MVPEGGRTASGSPQLHEDGQDVQVFRESENDMVASCGPAERQQDLPEDHGRAPRGSLGSDRLGTRIASGEEALNRGTFFTRPWTDTARVTASVDSRTSPSTAFPRTAGVLPVTTLSSPLDTWVPIQVRWCDDGAMPL